MPLGCWSRMTDERLDFDCDDFEQVSSADAFKPLLDMVGQHLS